MSQAVEVVSALLFILCVTTRSVLASNSPDSSYISEFHHYEAYCGVPGNNYVLNRRDGFSDDIEPIRPWSLRNDSFDQKGMKACGSLEEILSAIRNGERVWDENVVLEAEKIEDLKERDHFLEMKSSKFIPSQCSIPYLGEERACAGLSMRNNEPIFECFLFWRFA